MAHSEHHSDNIRRIGGEAGPRRLVCPSIGCSADGWYIEREPSCPDTWQIRAEEGGTCWTIAAQAPICPYCASTLGERHEPALDIGPFSHFVRSLAA